MLNRPEAQKPQEGKLVLPMYADEEYDVAAGSVPPYTPFRPDQLIRHEAMPPPKKPIAKLRYFWRKDPAYKVLMIALGTVLIAALVGVSLISNTLLRNPKLFTADNSLSQSPPTVAVPNGTVDLRPAFPTPGGGNGTGSSSLPPTKGTPALQPTSTAQPGPTPGGPLTVQITSIPNRVLNNSVVDVSVNTSLPYTSVSLVVIYSGPPYRDVVGPATTNDNGDATLSWSVSIQMFGRRAQALVYAVARSQNGQRVQSQSVTVQITNSGG